MLTSTTDLCFTACSRVAAWCSRSIRGLFCCSAVLLLLLCHLPSEMSACRRLRNSITSLLFLHKLHIPCLQVHVAGSADSSSGAREVVLRCHSPRIQRKGFVVTDHRYRIACYPVSSTEGDRGENSKSRSISIGPDNDTFSPRDEEPFSSAFSTAFRSKGRRTALLPFNPALSICFSTEI